MPIAVQQISSVDEYTTIAGHVPYYAQYASPELIYNYIHHDLQGQQDPRWHEFGTEDVDEYNFWCRRACGIACLKMGLAALTAPDSAPSMMELIRQGIDLGGYKVYDEQGTFIDKGWYYQPLVELAQRYGVRGKVCKQLTFDEICAYVAEGSLVIASVSPEVGEREDVPITYQAGHLVLVYGFAWSLDDEQKQPHALVLHNPSGRHPETRENALISRERFMAAFAQRGFVLSPEQQEEI